jgi:hypothetical protein
MARYAGGRFCGSVWYTVDADPIPGRRILCHCVDVLPLAHQLPCAMRMSLDLLRAHLKQDGPRLAWLYQHGEVLDRHDADAGVHVTVRLLPADRARFERQE